MNRDEMTMDKVFQEQDDLMYLMQEQMDKSADDNMPTNGMGMGEAEMSPQMAESESAAMMEEEMNPGEDSQMLEQIEMSENIRMIERLYWDCGEGD